MLTISGSEGGHHNHGGSIAEVDGELNKYLSIVEKQMSYPYILCHCSVALISGLSTSEPPLVEDKFLNGMTNIV